MAVRIDDLGDALLAAAPHPAAAAVTAVTVTVTAADPTPPGQTLETRLTEAVEDMETSVSSSLAGIGDRASRVVAVARAHRLPHLVGRGRLVLADLAGRRRDLVACGRTARDVLETAVLDGDPLLASRAWAILSYSLFQAGLTGDGIDAALEAVRLLPDDAPLHLRIDHECRLAVYNGEQLPDTGYREQLGRLREMAFRHGDPHTLIMVLNNAAWLEHLHGAHTEAAEFVGQLLAVPERTGVALNSAALDTVTRVALETGDLETAERVAREMVGPEASHTETDALVSAMVTLAEVLSRRGDRAGATAAVLAALELSSGADMLDARVGALRLRAGLLAESGDHRRAHEVFGQFLEADATVHSRGSDARAAVARSSSGALESRRRTATSTEVARLDPLTSVLNRRGIDSDLTALVSEHVRSGAPLSVAFVDLDRFKSVNDQFSHEVGDAVLVAVARAMDAHLPPGGLVGRRGGEEFLLVLPGLDAATAAVACDRLRAVLAGLDWASMTADRPVTASFGVASLSGDVARPGDLTREADRRLYRAKRAGRDRVCWTPDDDRR